jgi:mannose-6-phosphate isomerase-like protein (cupin superfamily)
MSRIDSWGLTPLPEMSFTEERMRRSMCRLWVGSLSVALLAGCGGNPERANAPAPGEPPAPAASAAVAGAGERMVAVPTADANRPFLRVNFDTLDWRATEGNTLGVRTAVLEGDPSKPGFYLTINHFPPGVMSRPHYHPDERYVVVLRGTWNTGEGDAVAPEKTVPLKPGDYMRHPAGGHHYDGGLDEETYIAISGYGPTSATVLDGGELFGRVR